MSEAALQTLLPSATLGEVAESIVDGPFGSNLKTSDYVESGVPVLQGKNITGNRFVWKEVRYISDEKALQLKRSSTVVGDHLLIKIGSIGYSAVLDDLNGHDFAIIPANLARIRPDRSVVDDQYLHRVLTSDLIVRHFQKVASKTAQPALSLKKIKATQIPLPPLAEQKRIAGILDAADALRARRRESLAQLDTLLQSTFLDMFGDPVTNPMGWEMAVIGDLLRSVNYGTSKKADAADGTYPILRMGNITYSGGWDFENMKYIDLDEKELGKHLVHRGQILFNRTNSKELVGKTAVYREDQPIAFAGYLVRGVVNEAADAEYIGAFMNTPQIKQFLQNKCKSIVGMANINAKEFQAIPIAAPPPDLQHRFAAIVESVEQQKASQRAHLAELDTLFASLQSRAFNGEL